jgi:coniferyl-aldehyde dehydrogenase
MNASTKEGSAAVELLAVLDNQRRAFKSEGPVALATRIDRLDRCIALLVDHKSEICAAVEKDFGCRSSYVKPEKRTPLLPMNFLGGKAHVHYQPKGVVGIMTPWNVPVNMIFSPLADVLGAGNRAMIKPSEFTPNTAKLMQELFASYFEESEIAVVTGGPEVGAAFSALPLDHLIFTGATTIGQMVMRSAAENMVPVTLELGGWPRNASSRASQ